MFCLKMESLEYLSSSVIFLSSTMEWMLVSPQNFCVEALASNMMVFQGFGEAVRIRWNHEGEAIIMELVLSVALYGHWRSPWNDTKFFFHYSLPTQEP